MGNPAEETYCHPNNERLAIRPPLSNGASTATCLLTSRKINLPLCRAGVYSNKLRQPE